MNANEKAFYDALGVVPEVPADIIENVEARVRKVGTKRRIAIAACLLLTLIIPALVVTTNHAPVVHADELESIEELMYAFEFFTGEYDLDPFFDIDNDFAAADDVENGERSANKVAINDATDAPKGDAE